MNILYTLTQIDTTLNVATNILSDYMLCERDIDKLSSLVRENFNLLLSETDKVIQKNNIQSVKAQQTLSNAKQSLAMVPSDQKRESFPPSPQLTDNQELNKQLMDNYKYQCSIIEKKNQEIDKQNALNKQRKIELSKAIEKVQKISLKLNSYSQRISTIKNNLNRSNDQFNSNTQSMKASLNTAINTLKQTVEALRNTYNYAQPLSSTGNSDKIDSYSISRLFKIKYSKTFSSNNISFYSSQSDYSTTTYELDEETNNIKSSSKKQIVINTRIKEDFYNQLNDISQGDIIKVPSYNLFNLGNKELFDEMEKRGFKLLNEDKIIGVDGFISWEK